MKLMLNSALRGTATALALFFYTSLVQAVINTITYANIYISLRGNDICTHLPACLTLSHAINQFINSGRFKYRQPNHFFYEENFKLFFMHSCNPGIDKVHEATNRFSRR